MTRLTLALFALSTAPAFALCGGTCNPEPQPEPPTVEQPEPPAQAREEDPDVWTCLSGSRVLESRLRTDCVEKPRQSTLVEEDTYVGGKF